ncbi:DnaB-like helicase C-terminal domain-containing protein [Streptomyces fradiae]|uniref:DnaB-like helicase C-terminal domain-containing protein n=1 Tax=Streptomyces fradiae TaxID=1906 RepID=UPI0036FAE973
MTQPDTPWPLVNTMINLRPGTVTTIASLPTVGRSTLTLNMALHNAMKGICTLYTSGELSVDMTTEKVVSAMYGIDLRHNEVPLGGWDLFKERVTAEMTSMPLLLQNQIDIEPREAFTYGSIAGQRRGHTVELWFLDALAHFSKFTEHGPDYAHAMGQIRRIAREASIPVVVTARAVNDVEDEPLALKHLPEAVAELSDHVLTLHREGVYWRNGPDSTEATVTQLKPRGRQSAALTLHPRLCRFFARAT